MKNKKGQATIKDVAKLSGLSIATVDRVLYQRGKVSEKSVAAINEAIAQLDYKPNQIARALSTRKNDLKIGIVWSKVNSPFWNEIEGGIEKARRQLDPFGVELIADEKCRYERHTFADQSRCIQYVLERGINGLIFMPTMDDSDDKIRSIIPENIPYATVIDDINDPRRLFHVGPNDFMLGSLAAKLMYLFCRDQCNAVLLCPNTILLETQKRISGFLSKNQLDNLGMNILQVIPIPGITEDEIYQNLYRITKDCIQRYDYLNAFYVTDGLTLGCADAVSDMQKGGKIKIIGHEYTDKLPAYLESGVISAVIYQKPAEQFYRAISIFYSWMTGAISKPESNYTMECRIIMKENLPFIQIGEDPLANG